MKASSDKESSSVSSVSHGKCRKDIFGGLHNSKVKAQDNSYVYSDGALYSVFLNHGYVGSSDGTPPRKKDHSIEEGNFQRVNWGDTCWGSYVAQLEGRVEGRVKKSSEKC